MENNNKKDNIIPKSSISNNSYENFKTLINSYSNILSNLLKNNEKNFFCKNDIIIINDIINEIIYYSLLLLNNNNFIKESKDIIDIGTNITDNFYKIYIKFNIPKKFLKNPIQLQLLILQANFNLNFKYLKNYNYSEEILLKIIEFQKMLQLSNFHVGSSYFYLGLIYFYMKKYEESEKIIKKSQRLLTPLEFELNNDNILIKKTPSKIEKIKQNNNIEQISYNLSIKKSCNILRVLAEIYLLKKEYIKSISCIENAYYLYYDNYGINYSYTIFLRNKLITILNKIQNYMPTNYNFVINKNTDINPSHFCNSNEDNHIIYINVYNTNVIKGKNKYFTYKIEKTYLYQPLMISFYFLNVNNENKDEIDNNNYSPENLIKTLYFNKQKLLDFFGEEYTNTGYFYRKKNIHKILSLIEYKKNKISLNNKKLKSCLMWNID